MTAETEYKTIPLEEIRPFFLLLKLYKVAVGRVDSELRKATTLSLSDYELLYHLNRAGSELTFSRLGEVALLSPSRVSRQVEKLQSRGLVESKVHPTDRRALVGLLTPAGRELVVKAEPLLAQYVRTYFADLLPADRREGFRSDLITIVRAVSPDA